MIRLAAIVEGHGEVSAVPVLLRRFAGWRPPAGGVEILTPIRVHKDQFLNKAEEFHRYLMLAAGKCGDDGWILVMLDADDLCPAEQGPDVLAKAKEILPNHKVSVVFANREFEAWFIASAESLNALRGFSAPTEQIPNPDTIANAKGWMKSRISNRSYGETTDQPAFTARIDLAVAHNRSASFRKLCREWDKYAGVV